MRRNPFGLVFDLQRFAEEGGGVGGGDPNAGGSGGSGGQQGPNGAGKGAGGEGKVTFTDEQQAHIDKLIGERAKRAEASAAKKALEARAKELGFESAEEMEAAVKAHKDAQDKAKTDLEKAQEAAQKAEAEREKALSAANDRLIRAEVKLQASELGVVDADAAYALMDRSEVEVADDGAVKGVKEALEALVKAKPYLKGSATPGRSGGEFGGGQGSPDIDAQIKSAEEKKDWREVIRLQRQKHANNLNKR